MQTPDLKDFFARDDRGCHVERSETSTELMGRVQSPGWVRC
ncbi:MAG: hypothetical protein PVI99_04830 [Anaerolineales bacterium]